MPKRYKEILRSYSVLRNLSSVAIHSDCSGVSCGALGRYQIFDVIAHSQHQLIGDQPLVHQIQRQCIRHLPDNQPRLIKGIGTLEHLAGNNALIFGLICLYIRYGTGFPAPGMINKQLCVDSKEPIEQLLIVIVCRFPDGATGNITHGV